MKTLTMALVFVALAALGCYSDNEEELYPFSAANCNLSNVNYSITIKSILQNYGCIGCHSGISPSGNIKLDSYTEVKRLVDNGKLYGSITQSSGFSSMPKGGGKVNTCDINKIKTWIDAGAPNN